MGRAYVDALVPLVWQAAERGNFVPEVRQIRRGVLGNTPAAEIDRESKLGHGDREVKLGAGSLRGVESAVRLLQLVHGRSPRPHRDGTPLLRLRQLTASPGPSPSVPADSGCMNPVMDRAEIVLWVRHANLRWVESMNGHEAAGTTMRLTNVGQLSQLPA
ncbi:hypothetical protein ACEYXF_02945 [Streptomyces asiaticus]|uniref:hypothetical protein n=1 Tax=Streptomyces asiaticus TaxID=114695 RepID=UPI0039BEACC1